MKASVSDDPLFRENTDIFNSIKKSCMCSQREIFEKSGDV